VTAFPASTKPIRTGISRLGFKNPVLLIDK